MRAFRVKLIVFDFDGTLTEPGALDFAAIRSALGCPAGEPILEFISSLPDEQDRAAKQQELDRWEAEAAATSRPNPGAEGVVRGLREMGLSTAVISRNSRAAIERALLNFPSLSAADFDLLVSRELTPAPKPAPDGILWTCQQLHVSPDETMVVGDYLYDIEAGIRAGAVTVLLQPAGRVDARAETWPRADFTIASLAELPDVVRLGLPLPRGKLPNHFLDRFLPAGSKDPSVLVSPAVGEDVAVLMPRVPQGAMPQGVRSTRADAGPLIALKCDPVTLASAHAPTYAVTVNANDIATCGAEPRWFAASLLLPPGSTPSLAGSLIQETERACSSMGIALVGGHTEVTPAANQVIVAGTMVGVLDDGNLVQKRNMRPGDAVLMTKVAGLEGTAIIATEFHAELADLGLSETELEEARRLAAGLSVLPEARIASSLEAASAMHDVTEGGVVAALDELSAAGGHRLRINLDAVPVHPLTQKICGRLGLDPLGLIGSGSLLICSAPSRITKLESALGSALVPCRRIGEVLDSGRGIEATRADAPAEWPSFEVDELARLKSVRAVH